MPQESTPVVKDSFMKMLTYSLRNPPEYPYKRRILFEVVKHIDPALALKIEEKYNNEEECEYIKTIINATLLQ